MRKFFVISFALLTLSIICSGQDKKNRAIFPPSGKDKKVEVVKEDKNVDTYNNDNIVEKEV